MSEYQSLHINNFRYKVKYMNDSAGKQITMTAKEARDLHNDILGLIDLVAQLQNRLLNAAVVQNDPIAQELDGGTF